MCTHTWTTSRATYVPHVNRSRVLHSCLAVLAFALAPSFQSPKFKSFFLIAYIQAEEEENRPSFPSLCTTNPTQTQRLRAIRPAIVLHSMASLLLKGVHKRLGLPSISISCSSADATNIIASTTIGTGIGSSGRAIDRHSPRIRDPHRSSTSKPPRPSTSSTATKDSASSEGSKQQQLHGHGSKKKKKSTPAGAAGITGGSRASEKRLVSPATSSRFLLNSSRLQSDDLDVLALPPPPPPSFLDAFPGGEAQPKSPSFIEAFPGDASLPAPFAKEATPSTVHQAESSSSGTSSDSPSSEIIDVQEEKAAVLARSSSTTAARTTQVVVLRVSLHCKGCAGKVKKHIAKMEGVTSFDIDIASKKVTVVGDVTPLGVLTSVSKVKPAQFWPSQPCPPRASASF